MEARRSQPLHSETPILIHAEKLTRRFGEVVGVDRLDRDVQRGEVFGLLGPSGAGKTTSLRLLTGITRPTSGSARVLGISV